MKASSIILILSVRLVEAAEPGWLGMSPVSTEWKEAVPACDGRRASLVWETPGLTRLRATVLPAPVARTAGIPGLSDEMLKRFARTREAALKIEWFDDGALVSGFSRSFHPERGLVRSSYHLGDATVTRTVIVSDSNQAVFIHLLANKPGTLSFRVGLEIPPNVSARIVDRRQLVFSPQDGLASHVWVLPFESEVATEGNAIAVRGEGEALVIWSFASAAEASKSLPATLALLGASHDPGHSPPDPARIWHGVMGARLKSIENSP